MRYFLLIVVCLCSGEAAAQKTTSDQLFKKDGTTVAAKVLEITATEVKYKKATNPDGPTYTLLKAEVDKITYANGETETFSSSPKSNKTTIATDETPFGAENFLTFSNDGKQIITDLTFPDGKIYLCTWNNSTKLQSKLLFANRTVNEPLYNWQMVADDGAYLKNASLFDKDHKRLVAFVNPETGKPFGEDSKACIISPDGKRILIKTGNGPHFLYTFDDSGKLLATRKVKGAIGASAMKFSHSSKYYLFSTAINAPGSGTVEVLDADGNPVSMIKLQDGHTDFKYQPWNKGGGLNIKGFINFSSDDQFIIVPNSKKEVGLWEIKGTLVKLYPHFMAKVAAVSHDGKTVATAGSVPFNQQVKNDGQVFTGGQIKIWSLDGTLIHEIPFPVDPTSIEFTPDDSGIVVVVEGVVLSLWASENYALPAGADKSLLELAKMIEDDRLAEKKADRAAMWNAIGTGFVIGLEKLDKEMAAENLKVANQRQFINTTVNKALTDCRYAVFTRVTKDDWLEVSDIFKITRGCELNLGGGIKVYFGDTYEAADKLIKTVIEKEWKDKWRPDTKFEELNKTFGNGAKAGEGGCICK